MKAKLIITVVVFVAVFSVEGVCIDNPSVRNPAGSSATVPPTHYQSGLVRSPNPIDSSSNLIVTGNVGGGKHFRGVVPYNAISDFGGSLGSTELNSFLRTSGGAEYYGDYSGRLSPYYSERSTVTTLKPGSTGVLRPPASEVGSQYSGRVDSRVWPDSQPISGSEVSAFLREPSSRAGLQEQLALGGFENEEQIATRPISMTRQELEKIIGAEVGFLPETKESVNHGRTEADLEKFQQDLTRVSDRASELERKLVYEKIVPEKLGEEAVLEPLKQEAAEEETKEVYETKEDESFGRELDIYEQMKQQMESLREGKGDVVISGDEEKMKYPTEKLEEVGMSVAQAEAILGEHKTFASFSKDKFNLHMRAGEMYLKEGKYYRSADAYTLASIYKPGDPLAYAGKGHALFMAGEYMSSALYVSRALQIFPEYAKFKIDIESMVDERDKIENRILNIEEWLQRNDAAELRFLLSYIYYHLGRIEEALREIDKAYEKMADAPAVAVLREAIYGVKR